MERNGKPGAARRAVLPGEGHPRQRSRGGPGHGAGRFLGLRRGDLLLLAVLLAAALALAAGTLLFRKKGGEAVLTTPDGERTLDLSTAAVIPIDGKDGIHLVIRVEDGAVWFESSGCPDQICVHGGRLSRAGDTAACLPAGVVVLVTEGSPGAEGSAPADAVAG